jgi:hypothetical protein
VAALMPVSGILGQRLGSRLRLVIMGGSLAVALSFLYLLRLDTGSGYADGFLPAFVIRGLGIGLVMSSSSLAVMSAVPLARAGLASGTLTMARNIGTAMGVALFGAAYLQHVDSSIPDRLPAAPPAQVAQITAAADHFAPAGDGEARLVAEEAIVDGFVWIALVGLTLSGIATGSAFFIRHRSPTTHAVGTSRGSPPAASSLGASQPAAGDA